MPGSKNRKISDQPAHWDILRHNSRFTKKNALGLVTEHVLMSTGAEVLILSHEDKGKGTNRFSLEKF